MVWLSLMRENIHVGRENNNNNNNNGNMSLVRSVSDFIGSKKSI
jgi:hypothetical protein